MTVHDDEGAGERPSPAERRLGELLAALAAEPLPGDAALTRRVVHRARRQRAARGALVAAGRLAGALADGLALLARSGRPGDERS
jgi:hypothetical protein